ncbi:hypothetical protein Cadr_000011309 [Camelus dromedarius]|uniref:Uncharacterized protein n=1 Tax=Camelus dromedarius TaxID=9838 RepID=A0A5N4DTZ4_CAMDR|nr:hypothetical protein Cadr_000011309 [Camelus dromedarius]
MVLIPSTKNNICTGVSVQWVFEEEKETEKGRKKKETEEMKDEGQLHRVHLYQMMVLLMVVVVMMMMVIMIKYYNDHLWIASNGTVTGMLIGICVM